MIYNAKNVGVTVNPVSLSMRCPACRQLGSFEIINDLPQAVTIVNDKNVRLYMGMRKCPNRECCAIVFVVWEKGSAIISYPPERFDFDTNGIPSRIVNAVEEAIGCHANRLFVASAIMIRKALEEICEDRGASGGNLKERIAALGTKVILPKELLESLDDVRLLGNDAAHIESKIFDSIGQEEVEIALEVMKTILKSVYQYKDLVSRLKSLKKTP